MQENIIKYIQQFVLKAKEKIETINEEDNLLKVTIVQHSARIYRKVAQVTVSKTYIDDEEIPQVIKKYKFTNRSPRYLKEQHETVYELLKSGYIMRVIRYNKDGITVADDYYQAGPSFYYTNEQVSARSEADYERRLAIALEKVKDVQLHSDFKRAIASEQMPKQWSAEKRLKFINFSIAFYEISLRQDLFDFKEIGATYDPHIGGSKIFDQDRDDFLNYLKECGVNLELYGLVSSGTIVPVFFTGQARSEIASYNIGAVHATTDSAILQTVFTTNNSNLWLVENRAILTRMATEVEFLRETNSFIICLDGQIKSAHRKFIRQLLNSRIERAYVWTDYDEAGLTIAEHAVQILTCPYKIIGRNGATFTNISSYRQSFLKEGVHEQEEQLGGVNDWKKLM